MTGNDSKRMYRLVEISDVGLIDGNGVIGGDRV